MNSRSNSVASVRSTARISIFSPEGFYQQQRIQQAKEMTSRKLSTRYDLSALAIRDMVKDVELELLGEKRLSKRSNNGDAEDDAGEGDAGADPRRRSVQQRGSKALGGAAGGENSHDDDQQDAAEDPAEAEAEAAAAAAEEEVLAVVSRTKEVVTAASMTSLATATPGRLRRGKSKVKGRAPPSASLLKKTRSKGRLVQQAAKSLARAASNASLPRTATAMSAEKAAPATVAVAAAVEEGHNDDSESQHEKPEGEEGKGRRGDDDDDGSTAVGSGSQEEIVVGAVAEGATEESAEGNAADKQDDNGESSDQVEVKDAQEDAEAQNQATSKDNMAEQEDHEQEQEQELEQAKEEGAEVEGEGADENARAVRNTSLRSTKTAESAVLAASKTAAATKNNTRKKKVRVLRADRVAGELLKAHKTEALTADQLTTRMAELDKLVKRKGSKRRLRMSEPIALRMLDEVLVVARLEESKDDFVTPLVHGLSLLSLLDFASTQLKTTSALREVISVKGGPHNSVVVSSGVVPRMVQLLFTSKDDDTRYQICWGLTNLARGDHRDAAAVVDSGAVPLVVAILATTHPESDTDPEREKCELKMKHQAVWCIGNLAADCVEYRRLLLEHGALQALIAFLHAVGGFSRQRSANGGNKAAANKALVRTGAWALYNLSRVKNPADWDAVQDAIPAAASLLHLADTDALVNACWTVANLTDKDETHAKAVITENTLKQLVRLLSHSSSHVVTPVVKALGYFVLAGDATTQQLVDASGALSRIRAIVTCQPRRAAEGDASGAEGGAVSVSDGAFTDSQVDPDAADTRKLALWLVANIASGNSKHVAALFEQGIVDDVMALWDDESTLSSDDPRDVAVLSEGAWVLCNASRRGNHKHIRSMVAQGYLDKVVRWGLQKHQQRALKIHTLKGLWCTLAMGSRNRRCTCNDYFGAASKAGLEPLVRDIQASDHEKRVQQWCDAIVYIFDSSRKAVDKESGESVAHWNPGQHKCFPHDFREGAMTLALCQVRMAREHGCSEDDSSQAPLTRENVESVLQICASSWFCRPSMLLE